MCAVLSHQTIFLLFELQTNHEGSRRIVSLIVCGKIIKFNLKFDQFHSTEDTTLDSEAKITNCSVLLKS